MVIQHIRWQAGMALGGILLVVAMLGYLSSQIETVLLPEPGGAYIEGIPSYPSNLNPLFLQTRADHDLAGLLFRSLTRPTAAGTLEPELARDWEVNEGGKVYTFHLREDVRWHDGQPFTAEDVAFTVKILQAPEYVADVATSELWRQVEVTVLDPHTVQFTLSDQLAPFAPFPSFTTFYVLPHHLLANVPVSGLANAAFSHQPVGTGPWRIAKVEREQLVLEPHEDDFENERPLLDQLIFRFYDGVGPVLRAYRRGEVMGVAQIDPANLSRAVTNPSLSVYPAPITGYTALFFNLKRPALQERAVREALMVGLDRKEIVNRVLEGQGVVANSFLLPTHWAYNGQFSHYVYDQEEALQILEEAGWEEDDEGVRSKDGEQLTLTIVTNDGSRQLTDLVQEIARQWSALGIEVEREVVSPAEMTESVLKPREFDVVILATPTGNLPADPDFYPLWHSSQADEDGQNYSSFSSEEADELLVAARRTLDTETRRAYYQEFQTILARQLPAIPLYNPIYNYAVSDLVKDVQIAPMARVSDRFHSLPDWYIKVKRMQLGAGEPTPTPVSRP